MECHPDYHHVVNFSQLFARIGEPQPHAYKLVSLNCYKYLLPYDMHA